ncbi:hypothetical protein V1478_012650 [Vespula squamosa]|uniref:Uncharacterized protein n=1 Tax=Vespula squamosa TaxID=30214 RepID=A0ABD2AAU7_VESSQ
MVKPFFWSRPAYDICMTCLKFKYDFQNIEQNANNVIESFNTLCGFTSDSLNLSTLGARKFRFLPVISTLLSKCLQAASYPREGCNDVCTIPIELDLCTSIVVLGYRFEKTRVKRNI